jgi:hypothetical protein
MVASNRKLKQEVTRREKVSSPGFCSINLGINLFVAPFSLRSEIDKFMEYINPEQN